MRGPVPAMPAHGWATPAIARDTLPTHDDARRACSHTAAGQASRNTIVCLIARARDHLEPEYHQPHRAKPVVDLDRPRYERDHELVS